MYFKSQKKTQINFSNRGRKRLYGVFVVEMIPRKMEHTEFDWSQPPVRPWQWQYRQVWVTQNRTRIQGMMPWQAVFCSISGSIFLDHAEFIRKLWPLPCKDCWQLICWIDQTCTFLWKGSQKKCGFLETNAEVCPTALLM